MEKHNLILLQVIKTNNGLMGWGFCLFLGFCFVRSGDGGGVVCGGFFSSQLFIVLLLLAPFNYLVNLPLMSGTNKQCFCVTMNKGQNQMLQEGQTE